ncbi:ABC transporter permease [Flammeovirga yaeyamensis]|uniref:ABC transporter permease n=1 Tax=Flammeovirga yaeyamensis TaxID=367791 RepID=A0AAX1MYP3_9BACT|nr:ABC transporter permease [Flammeovirga yaeyamensis]MBB3696082.1 ABC-2 type transport system permease protein [Flammeovirga yaeyamensis]NMF34767.1 ABC transporter permease [Flammeovirga yaeyamensis]QWG00405.1 ABC transporter permease [Flammeovirga yaeyamensis]
MKELKAFYTLVKRELRMFFKNDVLIAVFFGAPIFFGLLVGYTYQQASVKDLSIAVIDHDNSPLSHKIIDALDENFYLSVNQVSSKEDDIKDDLPSFEAIVRIPDGFEGDINYKRHPHIQVEVNGANMITGNYANIGIRTVLGTLNAGIEILGLHKTGIPLETAKQQWEAFSIDDTRYFNATSNYLTFIWPGIIGAVMQQVFLLAMALTFSKEHEENTFGEISKITKNPLTVFFSKAIPYWLIGIALWIGLQLTLFPLFKLPMPSNYGVLLILTSVFILSLTCLGILVSWLLPSQLKATEVLMVISTPSFILSGFTWPLEAMPEWIQHISSVIPLTHFLHALRKVLHFNADMQSVLPDIQNMLVITLFSAIVMLFLLFKKLKKKVEIN